VISNRSHEGFALS